MLPLSDGRGLDASRSPSFVETQWNGVLLSPAHGHICPQSCWSAIPRSSVTPPWVYGMCGVPPCIMAVAPQVMAMAPSQVMSVAPPQVVCRAQPQVMAVAMEGCGGQWGGTIVEPRIRGVVGSYVWGCAFGSRG